MGFHLYWRSLVSLERFNSSFEGEEFYPLKAMGYYYILAQLFFFLIFAQINDIKMH